MKANSEKGEERVCSVPRASAIRRAANRLLTIELAVLAVLALLCFGGAPFGIRTYGVLSGSMEPAIQTGALAFVDAGVAADDLQVGDVAAFDIGDGKVCTHRVAAIDPGNRQIQTKGDANADPDAAPVAFGAVFGKTVASLPGIGALLLAFNEQRTVWLAAIGAATGLLAVLAATSPQSKDSRKKEK